MPKIHDAQPAALLRASRVAAGGLIDRRVFLRGGAVAGLALAGGWTPVRRSANRRMPGGNASARR
jgi:hypothetical protein